MTDRLIEAGVTYIHASLVDVLNAKPLDATDGTSIATRFVERAEGRVPVIAAGMIRTPEQAEQALTTGLPLVAVGQALVMNPDWVELARDGKGAAITTTIDLAEAPSLAIPARLTGVSGAMTGWFAMKVTAAAG